ncbi:hypothetical protein NKH86_11930 [Mesorhizobium sp. M0913]|uniref:hypothetical protein n=1 Tax=Mesorhizobium sp. M0913 TaxID=2957026 RepID=UPI0033382BA7
MTDQTERLERRKVEWQAVIAKNPSITTTAVEADRLLSSAFLFATALFQVNQSVHQLLAADPGAKATNVTATQTATNALARLNEAFDMLSTRMFESTK